jgi:twinkle protein
MNQKRKCPQCQHQRSGKNQNDKPLSYNTETMLFNCHHCGWKGSDAVVEFSSRAVSYRKPEYKPEPTENEKLNEFFAKRGIPVEVLRRNQIEARKVWMPRNEREERVICFPYYRNQEIVNVKYRTADKDFKLESGAELIFYGIDDIDSEKPLIFVEGEIDKLSAETAGFRNCVSVPNGAKSKLDILAGIEPMLGKIQKFIIASDNDEPGQKLQAELIRRLGAEKCYRAIYPEGCKDLNDVLVHYGVEAVQEAINFARPMPIEGVFQVVDVLDDLIDLYRNGRPRGEYCGWDNLADLYKPRLGTWTVVTGSPNAGKSPFLRAMMMNLAVNAGWKFLVFPPEDCPPELYYSYLTELYTGLPFEPGPTQRMSEIEMIQAAEWVHDRFVVMNPEISRRSLPDLLKLTKSSILRHGTTSLVVDPYNRLEHFQAPNQTQDQYNCQLLGEFDAFCKQNKMHNYFVAHPTKLRKENGAYPVPTLYDISGSAHWFNMPDFGISVWRDKDDRDAPLCVNVLKVKNNWCGQLGMAELFHDRVTGRFSQDPGRFRKGERADALSSNRIQ